MTRYIEVVRMREEANKPPNAPLLKLRDSLQGSISASLNALLSTPIGSFLASMPQPSSLFLSRLQELALAPPDASGDLMGVVDSMLREGRKYVRADQNGEASGFLRNLNFSVSELLPQDQQTEFNALVGITYTASLTCTTCQSVKKTDPVEPYMFLQVPKNQEIDLEEAICSMLKKRESGEVMNLECAKSTCRPRGEKAQKRSHVSQLPKVLILVFNQEEKKQHQTKPMLDNKISVQGKTYQLSSIIHHTDDSKLATGNYYCDLVIPGPQSSWPWRCNQEDRRGPREIENYQIGETYKLGHIYIFEEQHDNAEKEIR